jgi:hypothetical protein
LKKTTLKISGRISRFGRPGLHDGYVPTKAIEPKLVAAPSATRTPERNIVQAPSPAKVKPTSKPTNGLVKFTIYESPLVTVHRNIPGIRTPQVIVINEADATKERLQQLGHQLYVITAENIVATISIYTDTWAATTKIDFEDMTPVQQNRKNKAWIGQFRKRANGCALEYALGGLWTGTGENMEPSSELKTLQLP